MIKKRLFSITWHSGIPFEFLSVINSPARSKYDLASLRGGTLVGQIVTEDAKRRLIDAFPEMVVCNRVIIITVDMW